MTLDKLRALGWAEFADRLAEVERAELVRLLHSALAVEPTMRPREIVAVCQRPRAAVLQAIRDHAMGDYFCYGENSIAVPVGGVNRWRDGFKVKEQAR